MSQCVVVLSGVRRCNTCPTQTIARRCSLVCRLSSLAVAFGWMEGTSSDIENGESFSDEDGDNVANFVL